MPGGLCCELYSTATRTLDYWFYTSGVPEGGNLERFWIYYLLPTSNKCRKGLQRKVFPCWCCSKKCEGRRDFKNKKLGKPAIVFQNVGTLGTARESRKTLKPQETMPVFRKFSVVDWKPQHCTKHCMRVGRDMPLILATMSHGGWTMSPQDNHFRNSWQKEICSSSTQSHIPSKGPCLEWM